MNPCPNINLPDWKKLVDDLEKDYPGKGESLAHLAFQRNAHDIPTAATARELLARGPATKAAGSAGSGALFQGPEDAYRVEEKDGYLWVTDTKTGRAYKPGMTIYNGKNTPETRARLEQVAKALNDEQRLGYEPPPTGKVEKTAADPAQAIREAITPAGDRKFRPGLAGTLDELKAIGRVMWDKLRSAPEFGDYKKAKGKWDGARQIATWKARAQMKAYDKAYTPDAQVAMFNWIEAGGNETVLREWASKTDDPKLKAGYERALKLSPAERKGAEDTKQYWDTMRQYAIDNGLWINFLQNYATHIQQNANPLVRGLMGDYLYSKLSTRFKYAAGRVFPSAFEAEQMGFPLKTKKLGEVVAIWSEQLHKTLADRAWIKDNLDVKADDNRPVFAVAQGTGKVLEPKLEWVAGWPDKPSKVFYEEAGQTRADAERYAKQFPGMAVTEQQGKPPIMVKPWTKSADLADYRPVEHPALRKWVYAATTPEGSPVFMETQVLVHPHYVKDVENALGRSKLDDIPIVPALTKLQSSMKQTMLSASFFHPVQIGIHSAEHENFKRVKINPDDPAQRGLIEHGLNIGAQSLGIEDFSEGLMGGGSLLAKIPKIGDHIQHLNDWTFHAFIPEIKMSMGLAALERNRKRYKGQISDDQIQALTANQANAAFGELNYKMLGRNPTLQHFLRLTLLAPDFLEARGKFVGQAAKPFGMEQRMALMRGAVAMATVSYFVSKMAGEEWDWRHPFQIKYKGRLYGLRTVQGDILHLIEAPRSFAFGRISPLLGKTGLELVTGRDYRGEPVATKDLFQNLAKGWVPITFRTKGADQTLFDNFLQGVGVMEKKYRSPALDTARELQAAALPRGPVEKEKRDKSLLAGELVRKSREGKDVTDEANQAYEAGKITEAEWLSVHRSGTESELASVVRRLPLEDAKKVLAKATPQEEEYLRPLIVERELREKTPKSANELQVKLESKAEKDKAKGQGAAEGVDQVKRLVDQTGATSRAVWDAYERATRKLWAPDPDLEAMKKQILDGDYPAVAKDKALERINRAESARRKQRPSDAEVLAELQR